MTVLVADGIPGVAAGDSRFVERAARHIKDAGACLIRSLISVEEATRLRQLVLDYLCQDAEEFGEDYKYRETVHAPICRGSAFLSVLSDTKIIAVASECLGRGCVLHSFNAFGVPPGRRSHTRAWHRDAPACPSGWLTNIVIHVALDTYTQENGALELVTELDLPPFDQDEGPHSEVHVCGLMPGDAMAFNGHCWHRSGMNTSEDWRIGLGINASYGFISPQFDFASSLQYQLDPSIPEGCRRFLGFGRRGPERLDLFRSRMASHAELQRS